MSAERGGVPGRPVFLKSGKAVLIALIALGLVAAFSRASRSEGEKESGSPAGESEAPCGEWHRGAGTTSPVDLDAVRRAYAELRGRVAASLDGTKEAASLALDRPFDAGLPSCPGNEVRTVPLSPEKRLQGRQKRIYFVSVPDPGRFHLPQEVSDSVNLDIVALRVRTLGDLPEISRRAGRPVSLGSAAFARALGVRCLNSLVQSSANGEELEIHECR